MKTLKEGKVGETLIVKSVTATGAIARRVLDMGLTKGTKVYIRKVAPLGDPMELSVRGYELTIRKDDASIIEVE
ncbi:MAG: ferrous iron transport protein A [Erysipelotrichaceae bacterium]|nr:ferrous iron transport protein A [Erysipelotrichaceae bacterium]